jgi:hypothetical protein
MLVNMRNSTAVQLSERLGVGTLGTALADPGMEEDDEKPTSPGVVRVKAFSIELPVDEIDWADRYAEYRNALGEAEAEEADDGSKLPKRWSRKSLLESQLLARLRRTRKLLDPIVAELGPLPEASDKLAMKRYAKRALALVKKQS